ncbi:hypothetical protein C6A37_05500 [Desulfobacteraceae bacterium SEEP-SAG9]|nr:hypothetical protein C6A37_05500 [Desulfobacteraceae bacterium SEEP-SAG9]
MIKNKSIKQDILRLLPKVETYLRSRKDVQFAYLFGSYAKGKITPLSDVDIAVYLSGSNFSQKRLEILGGLIEVLKTDEIDLVILNTAPLPLKIRILRNRKLLVDRTPLVRHAFESTTMRVYLDFSKLEKRILERRYING